ncbi:glutamate-rich protein 3-like, partial [Mizuhopecten yessoensis]
GALMLHRQEPAVMHQGEVQTLCEITMKYHGPNLTLPRDQYEPKQEVAIDQQHCGGNTLTVFKERLKAGDKFTFISRRHRGFPFSLSVYVDGRMDFRISRCCEYKHFKGVRLGGKLGHFSLLGVEGATPCY